MNFLSPIDDYSDFAFRLLCQQYGAQHTCVPLVNVLAYNRGKNVVDAKPEEKHLGVQFVGNDPAEFGKAARKLEEEFGFVEWINLNCGCPSARTMGSGGGSALLRNHGLIIRCVDEMKKTGFQVSVKIRLEEDFSRSIDLVRGVERAGADFVIVHGRTARQGYSGKSDWEKIRMIKESVGIPVIGNGDINFASEGEELARRGYCDGYMVARAAMSNPMLFSDQTPSAAEKLGFLSRYVELYGEPPVKDVRLKAIQFSHGIPGSSRLRSSLSRADSAEEIIEKVDSFLVEMNLAA